MSWWPVLHGRPSAAVGPAGQHHGPPGTFKADTIALDFRLSRPGGLTVEVAANLPAQGAAVTVLFGPSGGGKTTTLRVLAGLERPQRGSIRWGDQTWLDTNTGVFVTPQDRRVGFLFQDYALFPHLTVAANIAFGLARRGVSRQQQTATVDSLLARFGLAGLADCDPRRLSGGQQQRVALARAVAGQPRLLLLDEPLSALDGPTRDSLRHELRRHLAALAIPTVMVTHDRTEALALGDTAVIIEGGRVHQIGAVIDVFAHPANTEVARVVGVETLLAGRVTAVADGLAIIAVGGVHLTALANGLAVSDGVTVCLRAEDVLLERGTTGATSEGIASARNRLPGCVTWLAGEGPLTRVGLSVGFDLAALVTTRAVDDLGLAVGVPVTALIKTPAVHVVPRV